MQLSCPVININEQQVIKQQILKKRIAVDPVFIRGNEVFQLCRRKAGTYVSGRIGIGYEYIDCFVIVFYP